MSWNVIFEPGALDDIRLAQVWYDHEEAGTGEDFVVAVFDAAQNLNTNPFAYRLRNRKYRVAWCYPKRFPYKIVFRVDGDEVRIIAVVHTARHDRVWKKRL